MNIKQIPQIGLLATLGAFYTGCSTYNNVDLPVIDSESYTKLMKTQHKKIPLNITELDVSTAQELALANNPNFISKRYAMKAAWARYYQSLSSYFPSVSANYTIDDNNASPRNQKRTTLDKTRSAKSSFGISAQWLVFDGLMRTMNALASKHLAKQSENLEEDAKRLLLMSTTVAYNNVLLAVEAIRIAKTDKNFQSKLLNESNDKYEAGAASLSEKLNFEVKVKNAESALVTARFNYTTSKYVLAQLMGLTEGNIPDRVKFPAIPNFKNDVLMNVETYIDIAINNRPDLKSLREALKVAEYNLYAKWGAFSPTVNFNYLLNENRSRVHYRHRNGSLGDRYYTKSRVRNYNYNLTVNWVITNGGQRFTALKESKATFAEAKYLLLDKWINIIAEVRHAYDNYKENDKQLKLTSEILGLQKQGRDLVQTEYSAGNASLTRLNEAQRDLVQAETNFVSAKLNLLNAKAQLDAVTNSLSWVEKK